MTVEQLIEMLNQFPKDYEIDISSSNNVFDIDEIVKMELSKEERYVGIFLREI